MLREFLGSFSFFKLRVDDDFVDRLHYFFTTNVLVSLSILVSWKQFGGKPLECMVPDLFTPSWEQYTEQYCWAKNTYYLPFKNISIPQDVSERKDRAISYYQWVPFFLLVEAACFHIPSLFWRLLAGRSGIKITSIIRHTKDHGNIKPDIRKSTVQTITCHLENALRFHRRLERRNIMPHRYMRIMNLPYSAGYVTMLYLFVKALYLANVVGQWVLLNRFMQTDRYSYYGFDVIADLLTGSTWEETGAFPRVTLCDFRVRTMGTNVQKYTIQCVLVINLFNEKIFVFLWFWYIILVFLTAASFVWWFLLMIFPWPSRWFISLHMELSDFPFDPKSNTKSVEKFVSSYLRLDGIFILRMITMHTGVIFTTELISSLWKRFYGIEEERKRLCSRAVSNATDIDMDKSDKQN